LCEEHQFETEVLSGLWLWNGHRYRDSFIFNVSNPKEVSSGAPAILHELNPISLVDNRVLTGVDRTTLDEQGILSFSTQAHWSVDAAKPSWRTTDLVIIPHYVFASLLANNMQTAINEIQTTRGSSTNFQGYPSYYPLLLSIQVQSIFDSSRGDGDYVSSSYTETGKGMQVFGTYESLARAYFVAERLGLQGLSFMRSIWDGESDHCGYDSDCMTGPKGVRLSMTSRASCAWTLAPESPRGPLCNPTSLKYAAHGLDFGVSSLRSLAGTSFYGKSEVAGGDGSIWDFNTFSKVGTTWSTVHEAFFLLYDIVLVGEERFIGLSALRWSLTKYHARLENCGGQSGGGDSPGIDCSSPAGLVNVGPSFDSRLPGPVYLSSRDFTNSGVQVLSCTAQVMDCEHRSDGFELLQHRELGFRLGFRNSNGIIIGLQKNGIFTNSDAMIPLYLDKEYFYIGQWNFYRIYQYEWSLNFTNLEHIIFPAIHAVMCIFLMIVNFRLIYKAPQMDNSSMFSGSYCT